MNTTFVLITDLNYFHKAKRTIVDLRSKGKWNGDIVLITIDFNLTVNFKDFHNIIEISFPKIDKSNLLASIGKNGFSSGDKRELNKLNQWEKLHVFDDYFKQWNRVIFMDAGLRILDEVSYLLELDYKDKILAPCDDTPTVKKLFKDQLSYDNPLLIDKLINNYGDYIFNSSYMLNCIWIYDTKILDICNKSELIEAMNEYTICKTNEMTIMNLLFHFKYKLWSPFPIQTNTGKFLFDWCELNRPGTNWRNYCYIKYPVTINFEEV